MKKLVIASGNAGKVREFKEILKDWEITSMKEEGVFAEVDETGVTFEENAEIKARALADRLKTAGIDAIAIADDSGMEVDAFDGGPGVYSARYLGEKTPYEEKNRIILEKLIDVPEEKEEPDMCARLLRHGRTGESMWHKRCVMERLHIRAQEREGLGMIPFLLCRNIPEAWQNLLPTRRIRFLIEEKHWKR